MTAPNPNAGTGENAQATKAMTAADAAKRVKRVIRMREPVMKNGAPVADEDGKPQFKEFDKRVDIGADEVLSFKDYGTHVVVVTKDGQKFSSAD
ncbi:MAG: hypothetical protein LCH79_07900 [Proteobacteria bacterium]|nr:hypothetical protein [Pseudomonadota bacterium]